MGHPAWGMGALLCVGHGAFRATAAAAVAVAIVAASDEASAVPALALFRAHVEGLHLAPRVERPQVLLTAISNNFSIRLQHKRGPPGSVVCMALVQLDRAEDDAATTAAVPVDFEAETIAWCSEPELAELAELMEPTEPEPEAGSNTDANESGEAEARDKFDIITKELQLDAPRSGAATYHGMLVVAGMLEVTGALAGGLDVHTLRATGESVELTDHLARAQTSGGGGGDDKTDVASARVDFVLAGFPKAGTTTVLANLASLNATDM